MKTYQNGVRIGYSDNDIRNAGTYIANKGAGIGNMKFGEYNGVRIGIFVDSGGKPTTIFLDNMKQINPDSGLEGGRD